MTDLGVVDPIRVPSSIEAFVRRMPRIAQVFIVLAILDVIGRGLGVVNPGLYLSGEDPESFLTAFLPRDALILLPAVVLLRRPDAETATSWLLRGAVIVALVELLRTPTILFITGDLGGNDVGVAVVTTITGAALTAIGWIVLGRGLAALNPLEPAQWVAGMANLAAGLVVGSILLYWIAIFIAQNDSGGYLPSEIVTPLGGLAWAYLLRVVIRGFDDPSRNLRATRVATLGALLSAGMLFFGSLLSFVLSWNLQTASHFIPLLTALSNGETLVGDTIGVTLLVIAFGLGLADPLRPMPKDWAAVAG